jgi:hypothetical protein
MPKRNEMNKKWLIAVIPGSIIMIALVVVIALLLIKVLWTWIIPDLFPAAVVLGLVARTISWYTAFKIAIVIGLLSGVFKAGKEHHEWKRWKKN